MQATILQWIIKIVKRYLKYNTVYEFYARRDNIFMNFITKNLLLIFFLVKYVLDFNIC